MIIIISGLAGSGKSTVARAVAKKFGLRHISAGDKMRQLAIDLGFKSSGSGFVDFQSYVNKHSELDIKLDKMIINELSGDCVVDSRLAPYLFKGSAFRVYLKVSDEVAAKRNSLREGVSLIEAFKLIKKRNKADALRYNRLYNIDINDLSVYDLLVDTSDLSIRAMNSIVIQAVVKLKKA